VAMPENPMVQLGDFHFAHNQAEFSWSGPMLLGWVTNNYWETNFRPHQPGRVHARIVSCPIVGASMSFRRIALDWRRPTSAIAPHLGEPERHPPLLPEAEPCSDCRRLSCQNHPFSLCTSRLQSAGPV
jgi:hypothetical protein